MTPNELAQAIKYNRSEMDEGSFSPAHIVQLVEHWQRTHDLRADGWCGLKTQASLDIAMPFVSAPDPSWTFWDGPMSVQPINRKTIYQTFGNPGGGELDKAWVRDNIVECHPRYGNQLPGVPDEYYVQVNKHIEPYLREALRRAQAAAPNYKVIRVGCFNYRHMRHDPANPLSTHSWGIAVDINPRDNYSKTFLKGEVPIAWSPEWMKLWPAGIPRAFVAAFQSCGFAWGSDWNEDGDNRDHTYQDPMHFEWVARDGKGTQV